MRGRGRGESRCLPRSWEQPRAQTSFDDNPCSVEFELIDPLLTSGPASPHLFSLLSGFSFPSSFHNSGEISFQKSNSREETQRSPNPWSTTRRVRKSPSPSKEWVLAQGRRTPRCPTPVPLAVLCACSLLFALWRRGEKLASQRLHPNNPPWLRRVLLSHRLQAK